MKLFFSITLFWVLSSVLTIFILKDDNATRVRNSLIADLGLNTDFDWFPDTPPDSFRVDHLTIPEQFTHIAQQIKAQSESGSNNNFDNALLISKHIVKNKKTHRSIRKDSIAAYHSIMLGDGYCADYSQVFNAISLALGIPVREWGFGFNGYGPGHAFNEIYDDQYDKWILIDSFHSFYFIDKATQSPLSAQQVQHYFSEHSNHDGIQLVKIDPNKFTFESEEKALKYYQAGHDQFYLFWGNNEFSNDGHPALELLARYSRSLGVITAIATGVHPRIKLSFVESSNPHLKKLFITKNIFMMIVFFLVLIFLSIVVQIAFKLRHNSLKKTLIR